MIQLQHRESKPLLRQSQPGPASTAWPVSPLQVPLGAESSRQNGRLARQSSRSILITHATSVETGTACTGLTVPAHAGTGKRWQKKPDHKKSYPREPKPRSTRTCQEEGNTHQVLRSNFALRDGSCDARALQRILQLRQHAAPPSCLDRACS